jgi:hypothetical protein
VYIKPCMAKEKSRPNATKLRSFWQRTSDGLNAEQLWAQFRRETRSSLNLYSAETGRNLREEWSARKGRRRVLAAVVMRHCQPVRGSPSRSGRIELR